MKKMMICLLAVGSMTSFAKNVETIKSNIIKMENVVINNANDIDDHRPSAKEINQIVRQATKDIRAVIKKIPAPAPMPTPRPGRGGNGGGRGANRPSPMPTPGHGNGNNGGQGSRGHSQPTPIVNMILVNTALNSCSSLASYQAKTCYENFFKHESGLLQDIYKGCNLIEFSSSKTCFNGAMNSLLDGAIFEEVARSSCGKVKNSYYSRECFIKMLASDNTAEVKILNKACGNITDGVSSKNCFLSGLAEIDNRTNIATMLRTACNDINNSYYRRECYVKGTKAADSNGYYIGPYVNACSNIFDGKQSSQCFDRALMAITF